MLKLSAILLLLLTSCAQQPTNISKEVYSTDFSTGISLVAGYFESGFLVLDCNNGARKTINIWLIQEIKTHSAKVKRETLLYEGDTRSIHKQFKLSPTEGEGHLTLNVLDRHNSLILQEELK